jgi:plasmid stability protein
MAQIILDNLDPAIAQQLEILAQQHGRTLQEEAKILLTEAVVAVTKPVLTEEEITERKFLLMEQQLKDHARKMGKAIEPTPPRSPEEQQRLGSAFQGLKELRKKMSLGGFSIREAREEGRRY